MTLILRVKCHGLDKMKSPEHMKEVMNHIAKKQKVRVDEEEGALMTENRNGKCSWVKSS